MVADSQLPSRPFNGMTIPLNGTYTLDPPHTFAYFTVQHLVVGRVRRRFNTVSGTITITDDPLRSTLDVRIETASVDTQNATRDADLRSPHFLNVAAFPLLRYCGTGVTPELAGRWAVAGELTVRDVTRSVTLGGVFGGAARDASDHLRVAFQASTAISRKEFSLTWELEKESGGILLRRDITIENQLENNPYKVMFASGDWTCTIAKWKGRMIGPMTGPDGKVHSPTNKTFELEFCTVAHWKDGEIVEENLFYDQVGFLKQIGVM